MKRYIRASFNNEIPKWFKQDKRLLQALSEHGLDLANLTLTQDKAKRKKDINDPDSQYVVYLIDTGYRQFVWIPGVYNDDETMSDPRTRGSYKAVKYIPKKYLNILETWYIDRYGNTKKGRQRYQNPRYEYSRYDRRGRYAGQRYYMPNHVKDPTSPDADDWGYRPATRADGEWKRPLEGRDKSGYLIPKPSERLMEFFNSERGLKSLGNRLQDVYEDLIDVQESIFRVDFTTFGKDSQGNSDINSSAYRNMIHEFGDATNNYKRALRYLNNAQEQYEDRQSETFRYSSYDIKEAFDYIRSIKKDIERIRKILETENEW